MSTISLSTKLFMLTVAVVLNACGGGTTVNDTTEFITDSGTARGTLIVDPPRQIASFEPNRLSSAVLSARNGSNISDAAGTAVCGIDFYRIQYQTVGAQQEPTATSGVLMLPTGLGGNCSGARPIVAYAHGASGSKSYDLAAVGDSENAAFSETLMIGSIFAAKGYIVVAPNYVGYAQSTLGYHPYLNADQQSADMIDALAAARKGIVTLSASKVSDNGKLFLTGYSQGGYVAMATQRALQANGKSVSAAAPLSGPYALLAFLDRIMLGQVNLGSTLFMPLATTSMQRAYGNLYRTTNEIYEDVYASNIESLLPSTASFDNEVESGKLPKEALFSSTTPIDTDLALTAQLARPSDPVHTRGFGVPHLVKNSLRLAYAQDVSEYPDGANTNPQRAGAPVAAKVAHPIRIAAQRNDLRNWQPTSPTLLCGGRNDPTVYWEANTTVMQTYWAQLPAGRLSVVDLDSASSGSADIYAGQKSLFAAAKRGLRLGGQDAVTDNYHVTLAPFCVASAREFFDRQQ